MSAADVLKMIQESNAKFVDFRFTDTRGKEQHVSVPAGALKDDTFEDGKMFDGSSIAGWKGINESVVITKRDHDQARFFNSSSCCEILSFVESSVR